MIFFENMALFTRWFDPKTPKRKQTKTELMGSTQSVNFITAKPSSFYKSAQEQHLLQPLNIIYFPFMLLVVVACSHCEIYDGKVLKNMGLDVLSCFKWLMCSCEWIMFEENLLDVYLNSRMEVGFIYQLLRILLRFYTQSNVGVKNFKRKSWITSIFLSGFTLSANRDYASKICITVSRAANSVCMDFGYWMSILKQNL